MAATIASTSLGPVEPVFTDAERLALAGYLAGYRGLTREACTLDLRQFTGWCRERSLPLLAVRRAARSVWPPGHWGKRAISMTLRLYLRPKWRIRTLSCTAMDADLWG